MEGLEDCAMKERVVFRGGRDAQGSRVDVAVDEVLGVIDEIGDVVACPTDKVQDCGGMVILPAPVDPHAHLDKALLHTSRPDARNLAGDLEGAIALMHSIDVDFDDVQRRAYRAIMEMVGNGTTYIRTHVDVRDSVGTRNLRALQGVVAELRKQRIAEIQIVCLLGSPLTGTAGKENRKLLEEAIELGVDIVGGCPYLDDRPKDALTILLDAASEAGRPVDFHTDETLAPEVFTLRDLISEVERRGVGGGVTASHCVSLGIHPEATQREVGRRLAELEIAVVALPQTNLYLQARGHHSAPARGITPVTLLREEGVTVAAGADNVRDPFCPIGRFDAFETAALLVLAAHLDPYAAWEACSAEGRKVLGLPPASVAVGESADLLIARGNDLVDALAQASQERTVVHRGRVVARTKVHREWVGELDLKSNGGLQNPFESFLTLKD